MTSFCSCFFLCHLLKIIFIDSIKILKIIFIDSIKILKTNPKKFISIYTLTILPLSFLLFVLLSISQPTVAQIYFEEILAKENAITPFESLSLWEHIGKERKQLFLFQFLVFIPSYVFSLLALITTVHLTSLCYNGGRRHDSNSITSLAMVVKLTWKRPLITSIYIYVILFGFCTMTLGMLRLVVDNTRARILVTIQVVFEVYLMAVCSMGIVDSVLEERFGLEAIGVGWDLMGGKWFFGWSLAGLMLLMTSGTRWGFGILMDGHDWIDIVGKIGLMFLLGFVILLSYVVNTIFYFERYKHVGREQTTASPVELLPLSNTPTSERL